MSLTIGATPSRHNVSWKQDPASVGEIGGIIAARAILIVVVACAAAYGCGRTYHALPSEDRVPEFAALKQAGAGLPEHTTHVEVSKPDGRQYRVAVHETAAVKGQSKHLIVFVHGVVSDSKVWRYLRGPLGREHDLMTIDLLGCGDSDRPAPAERGADCYAPEAMARTVLEAVRQRLAAHDAAVRGGTPARLTLVGHSLGGSVILRMLANNDIAHEYADVLARVDGAVLFTPADVAVDPNQPAFRAVATVTDAEVAVARLTGILSERVAVATRDGVTEPRLAVREEADRTIQILSDPSRRRAAVAMLKQAVPLCGAGHDRLDWGRIDALAADYAHVNVPCLIVWGGRDEVLPVSMGYKLAEEIPGARLRIVTAGMHCLPVERPRECAALLLDFLSEDRVLIGSAKTAKLAPISETPFLAAAPSRPARDAAALRPQELARVEVIVPKFLELMPYIQIRPVFFFSVQPANR
jgi:pimeloyl-ACP methyl ester carboxylesterase